jgi:hypothetical protein
MTPENAENAPPWAANLAVLFNLLPNLTSPKEYGEMLSWFRSQVLPEEEQPPVYGMEELQALNWWTTVQVGGAQHDTVVLLDRLSQQFAQGQAEAQKQREEHHQQALRQREEHQKQTLNILADLAGALSQLANALDGAAGQEGQKPHLRVVQNIEEPKGPRRRRQPAPPPDLTEKPQ